MAGAQDLSRRNVSTEQTRPQNSKHSFAHQHPCGLKSALCRSRGVHAKHLQAPTGAAEASALPGTFGVQSSIVQSSIVQSSIVQSSIVQSSIVQSSIVQSSIVQSSMFDVQCSVCSQTARS
jgi:hypothetical protein